VPRVQSYASVQNFARQESAKAAMNHMRWNLASQVCKPFLPRPFSLLRRAPRIFARSNARFLCTNLYEGRVININEWNVISTEKGV